MFMRSAIEGRFGGGGACVMLDAIGEPKARTMNGVSPSRKAFIPHVLIFLAEGHIFLKETMRTDDDVIKKK